MNALGPSVKRRHSCPPSLRARVELSPPSPAGPNSNTPGAPIGIAGRPGLPSDGHVFENDYFEVRETDGRGWAAFARRDLHKNERILAERPLYKATTSGVFNAFYALDADDRAVAMSLVRNPIWETKHQIESVFRTNGFVTDDADAVEARGENEVGLFPIAARFNHACLGKCNVHYEYDYSEQVLIFTIQKPVAAGAELTIAYTDRPLEIRSLWGFTCRCGTLQCLAANKKHERMARNKW